MTIDLFQPLSQKQCSTFASKSNTKQGPLTDIPTKGVFISSSDGDFGLQVRRSMHMLCHVSSPAILDLGILTGELDLWSGSPLHIHITDEGKSALTDRWANQFLVAASNRVRTYKAKAVVPIAHQRQIRNEGNSSAEYEAIGSQYRLGNIRSNPQSLEPLLRGADGLIFDMSAIRASDAPGLAHNVSSGLYAEEACQIMRFAGEGSQMKTILIDTCSLAVSNDRTASLVAQMIWYAIEGYSLRVSSRPSDGDDSYTAYVAETTAGTLQFYFHDAAGKWWLRSVTDDSRFIPCSYEEYTKAIDGQLSDRLLYFL